MVVTVDAREPVRACQARAAARPKPQLIAPPKVLPAVAVNMAGQNQSGRNCSKANTAASDPTGSKVADKVHNTNNVESPC